MHARRPSFLLLAVVCLFAVALAAQAQAPALAYSGKSAEVAPGILHIGRINHPRITESSGIVPSRQFGGVFWTHNDGGGYKKQVLYGITREGRIVAEFRVRNALLHDWEDLAIDAAGHLYLADIGNNNATRTELAVYEIDEPDPKCGRSAVDVGRAWRLRFPQAPFDCESLFVWQGYGYIISKVFDGQRAGIYRFKLANQSEPVTLQFVTRLKIDSPVTGANISSDGKLLGVVAKSGAFVYRIEGEVARVAHQKPWHTKFSHVHIEGCCFVPEGLLATAETREIYLFTDEAFHPAK